MTVTSLCLALLLCLSGEASNERSIAFVIDVTGSMSEDLAGVIKGVQEILKAQQTNQNYNIKRYILSPFSDPDVGPLTNTTSIDTFLEKLQGLKIHGGGDCPELAMHGIWAALNVSLPRSSVYVFTDATAKDIHLSDMVMDKMQKVKAQLTYVLTGDCGNRQDPRYEIYDKTATASNGHVFKVNKGDVNEVISFITSTSYKSSIESLDLDLRGTMNITFPIDSSCKAFSVSLSGTSPEVRVLDPNGTPAINLQRKTLQNVLEVSKQSPVVGNWRVKVADSSTHLKARVNCHAEKGKTVDVLYGFSPDKDVIRPTYRPIAGRPSYVFIDVTGLDLKGYSDKAETLEIVKLDGTVISTHQLRRLTTAAEESYAYYVGPVVLPDALFRLKVKGIRKGHRFQRITATALQAETDPCALTPCGLHGKCRKGTGTAFTCACTDGHSGTYCTIAPVEEKWQCVSIRGQCKKCDAKSLQCDATKKAYRTKAECESLTHCDASAQTPDIGQELVQCEDHTACYQTREPLNVYEQSALGRVTYTKFGCQCISGTCNIKATVRGEHGVFPCTFCGDDCQKTDQFFAFLKHRKLSRST